MVWRKITVETKEEAVDILSSYLYDSWDIEGVEIEDGKGITQEEAKEIFADILPEERMPSSLFTWRFFRIRKRRNGKRRLRRTFRMKKWIIRIV